MAAKAEVSPSTYYRGKTVLEEAPEEVKAKVKSGAMSINEGYEKVRPSKKQPKEPKDFLHLPEELFTVMLDAIDEATEKGQKNIVLRHNGHNVTTVGEKSIELATS